MTDHAQDLEHLRMLSIFHYVVAGLVALISCLPFFHLFIGMTMLSGEMGHEEPFAATMAWFFIVFSALFILAGWALAVCLVLAGRYLAQPKNHTFCLVTAGLACIFMPFGTVLGVFTIIVLSRTSVKGLFEGA